jgi:hypothetical protein
VDNLAQQRAAFGSTREAATIGGGWDHNHVARDTLVVGNNLTQAVAGAAQVGEVPLSQAQTICLSDGTRITFAAARVPLEAELA